MLGNLAHWHGEERVAPADMPDLERLMLHRLAELDGLVRSAYADFDYKRIFAALNAFMTVDLSAFYFDIRKDALYCDPYSSAKRKACLTVLDHLFRCTVTWLAPMLCFTAEEAWLARDPAASSVHLESFPLVPSSWRRRAGGEMAEAARPAARGYRRARNRTGGQTHRLVARSRTDCLRRGPGAVCNRNRGRSRRAVHHLGRDAGGRRGPAIGVPAR